MTVFFDDEGSITQLTGDTIGAEFARFELVRVTEQWWTMFQCAERFISLGIVNFPSVDAEGGTDGDVKPLRTSFFLLLIEMAQFMFDRVDGLTVVQ